MAAIVLILLPSCGSDTPTEPATTPPPAQPQPAQITVSLTQQQATGASNQPVPQVQIETRFVEVDITGTNGNGLSLATISSISTSVTTSGGGIVLDEFSPGSSENTIGGGQSRTWRRSIPVQIPTGQGINLTTADTTITFSSLDITRTASGGIQLDDARTISPPGICTNNNTRACVFPSLVSGSDGRFGIELTSIDGNGNSVPGPVVEVFPDGALLGSLDVEVLIRIVDNCATNNRYGIDIVGPVDNGFTLTILDTVMNSSRTWTNPPGELIINYNDPTGLIGCPGP